MILGVLSFKGGQAKTTTAIHLAAFLNRHAPTVVIDCDPNKSAEGWASKDALPFKVVDENQTARVARQFDHLVIDSKARPVKADIESIEKNCDLVILPVTPDSMSLDALMLTLGAIQKLDKSRYRILLTICPPYPSHDADDARQLLEKAGFPVFAGQVRRAVAFQKAALAGVTVDQVGDPRAEEFAADYEAIGKEILKLVR